jgi:tRNA dimethylallyltransferase
MSTNTCIIICGPTAVGKTDYGIQLAREYDTEIISADSRQCFRELNIGVAKPSAKQLNQVHHYFINTHSIHEEVNAKIFEEYALNAAHTIFQKKETVVMVGGTGLYIKAFAEGLDAIPEISEDIRKEINEQYLQNGFEWLVSELQKRDAVFFAKGEMKNPQRMLRALEVKVSTGMSIIDFHSKQKAKRKFEIKFRLLQLPRETLYKNINERVDLMIENGLLKEAELLYPYKHLNALQTVGYRELFEYFDGKHSLEKAVEEIKKNTRHYAKRQMTWFRKNLENIKQDY